MIEILIDKITGIILGISHLGVFILMLLESTMAPLPSELVMPFAGFLVALNKMDALSVIAAATLGSLCGSLISYWLGRHFGIKIVNKFGKYLLLEEEHLKKAEKWFKRRGGITVFISRFVPGVRHVISIPAGVGKMNLLKFSVLTVIGAGIWNTFLMYLGFMLERNYNLVYEYTSYIDMILLFIVSVLVIYYISRIIKSRNNAKKK
jgi:membrane protein DedA with SNARE-associated domain